MTIHERLQQYGPELAYGTRIAGTSLIGGAVGYVVGYILDEFGNLQRIVFERAQKADEQLGKAIVEKGGPVGKKVVEVDKAQGDVWSRLLGRTPEKQRQWRERHGLEAPSYLPKEAKEEKPVAFVQQEPQVPQQLQQYEGRNYLFAYGLLFGALYGTVRHFLTYLNGRRERKRENFIRTLTQETADLKSRIIQLERIASPKESLETQVGTDERQ